MAGGSKERVVEVERFGDLRLHLGGKQGYEHVRGGQGPNKDQYQGFSGLLMKKLGRDPKKRPSKRAPAAHGGGHEP